MGDEETLTTGQVAEMCGVNPRTVIRWVQAGNFPGTQQGPGKRSHYRIPKDEVEAFIARMSKGMDPRRISQVWDRPGHRAILTALAETLQRLDERGLRQRPPVALIVEDDPDAGDIFEFALKTAGFAPAVVASGRAALTWLASVTPDILVLDLHLPDVPGTELLRRLRAEPRLEGVPVVVVTAHPEMAEEIEDEVALVLIKPVRYEELQDSAAELAGM